jgi:uncharacterized protein YndB with AHSA1/START domain
VTDTGATHTYDFRSAWRLDAPPEHVFAILLELDRYPEWWPQIRRVERVDAATGRLTVRSALPYQLTFVLERRTVEAARVLSATLSGDLIGWSRWDLRASGAGTELTFRERARVGRASLARIEPFARPAFAWNHAWMMRRCRAGLVAALAGFATAVDGTARSIRNDL